MTKQITMRFWRDDYIGPACLEYSWVPEGLRHTILLTPGQQEGSQTDSISDDLNPSHVQVYRLDNNNMVSTEMWQFPTGPPHTAPVDGATVEVYQQRLEVVGTVHYADGTSAYDTHSLDSFPRPCPEVPPTA
jgi:hypothetical protein